jgi:molybdopterin-guanine dinucleotide biosynthesis protein A
MGVDKAALIYRGQTLLRRAADTLATAGASKVLIAGGAGDLADPHPNCGPVGGLVALADYVSRVGGPETWLVVPVDMPLLTSPTLTRLVEAQAPAAHFANHPLPLMLIMNERSREALLAMREDLASPKGVSLWRVSNDLGAVEISPSADELQKLKNVNTPDHWANLTE